MWPLRIFYWGSERLSRASHALTVAMLAVSYFILIAPIAILFRLSGRDVLRLRRDPALTTWWRPHENSGPIETRMSRPF